MLKSLPPRARELAEYMSGISEAAYHAGWMLHLEYELWSIVLSGPRSYGRSVITQAEIDKLKALSQNAQGWIVFDDHKEESFVPLAEWQEMFIRWKKS